MGPPVDRILDTRYWKYYLAPNFVCGRWKWEYSVLRRQFTYPDLDTGSSWISATVVLGVLLTSNGCIMRGILALIAGRLIMGSNSSPIDVLNVSKASDRCCFLGFNSVPSLSFDSLFSSEPQVSVCCLIGLWGGVSRSVVVLSARRFLPLFSEKKLLHWDIKKFNHQMDATRLPIVSCKITKLH